MRGRPGTTDMLRCIVAQVQSFTGAVGQPVPLGPGPPAAPATAATAGPGPRSRPSGPRPGPTLAQVTHQFWSRGNQTRKRTGRFALLRDILEAGRPNLGRPRHAHFELPKESLTQAMKHIFRSIC